MKITKPMLSEKFYFSKVEEYLRQDGQLMVQTKYDGIRGALYPDGKVITRSGKEAPGQHRYALPELKHTILEFEMCASSFRRATSLYLSNDKDILQDDCYFAAFDWREEGVSTAIGRFKLLKSWVDYYCKPPWTKHKVIVAHCEMITSMQDINRMFQQAMDEGQEGLIIKRPFHVYKHGRSSRGESIKMKLHVDEEVTVTGMIPLERNHNEATLDELGHTTRSTHKAGKVQEELMGALIVDWKGKELKVGTGFTLEQRQEYYTNPPKKCEITYTPKGMKDLPRHPVFKRDTTGEIV